METPAQLDQRLHALCGEATAVECANLEVGIAQAVALTRIANSLELIEETGIYVYQQGTEDDPESDTVASSDRRRG